MKFIYSKFFIYPVFFISFFILYSSISNYRKGSEGRLRFLSEEDGLREICKKDKDLYSYYYEKGQYQIKDHELNELNKQSEIILDYIKEDFDSKYIFQYLGKSGTYIFFLILLILIIILTIYYTIASCIRCCTEKCCDFFSCSCCKNKCFKRTICVLIPFLYLIVFVLSLVAIAFAIITVDKFSGTACIGLQLVDSLILGENKNTTPKWGGISTVNIILNSLANMTKSNNKDIVKNIYDSRKNYLKQVDLWKNYLNESYEKQATNNKFITIKNPKMLNSDEEKDIKITPYFIYKWGPYDSEGTILREINDESQSQEIIEYIFSIFDTNLYNFLGCDITEDDEINCPGNSLISEALTTASDIIEKIKDPVNKLKEKVSEPINNIYDQVNSTVITIFSVVFVFVILYCIIIESLLSIFCCSTKCKCQCCSCCMRWTLCFIYYTSIFIVILGMAIGIVAGFIGNLVQNGVQAIQFITSTENLNNTNPIIFENNTYTQYLDVCLNGDGNLAERLGLTDEFSIIDNITNITDDTQDLVNETTLETSPLIDHYIKLLNETEKNYLSIGYYDIDNGANYILKERIDEINKYVSGEYYNQEDKKDSCIINENWNTIKEKEGYNYDKNYPQPDSTTKYLIYLYDENIYDGAKLETRYNNACPTKNRPYETVTDASKQFGHLFDDIGKNIRQNNYQDSYTNDLNRLNEIYGQKNKYLHETMAEAENIIKSIGNTFGEYVSDRNNIFSFLNCKFVGDNKLMLIDTLYTSLGIYLEAFGILTIIFCLFIFIGIVFIIILVKNNKKDENDSLASINLETLNDIMTGNDKVMPGSLLDSSEE